MSPGSLTSRLKPIDGALSLHEIIASVRQLSFMKQHSEVLASNLNVALELTYARAPVGRLGKGQTYELERGEKPDPSVRERLLEKRLWKDFRFSAFAEHGRPFAGDVCRFIQTYQMPLQGTRNDRRWGKIDLLGATAGASPAVIELKQEDAKDTLLRMLVEGVAYACAIRKVWNEGGLRAQWATVMKKNGLSPSDAQVLAEVPVLLLAPSDFWRRAVGSPGVRSNGKVRDDAWQPFLTLVRKCSDHGFPVHFLQFDTNDAGLNILPARLPLGEV